MRRGQADERLTRLLTGIATAVVFASLAVGVAACIQRYDDFGQGTGGQDCGDCLSDDEMLSRDASGTVDRGDGVQEFEVLAPPVPNGAVVVTSGAVGTSGGSTIRVWLTWHRTWFSAGQ